MTRDIKLDRVITVGILGPETFEDGTPVPGEWVDSSTWARQTDARLTIDRGDQTTLRTVRRYRVRYTRPIVDAYADNRLSVVIDGDRYMVEAVAEIGRRRWLELAVFLDIS